VDDALYFKLFEARPGKGDLRKMAILKTAIQETSRKGLDAVSLDSVAQRMGLTRSHVAYYFRDQRALFHMMCRFCIENLQEITVQRLNESNDPKSLFRASILAPFDWIRELPDQVYILFGAFHLTNCDEETLELMSAFRKAGYERLVAVIKSIFKGKSSSKVEILAKEIHCLLTGYLVEFSTSRHEKTVDEYSALALNGAYVLLRARQIPGG
jgi:AcrR family transcriptional regulator